MLSMKLAQYMKRKRMRQAQMAALIGVNVSTVSRLMRGLCVPERATMKRILEATGGKVKPNDFYTEDANA